MAQEYKPKYAWEPVFLETLGRIKVISRAAEEAGVTTGAYYGRIKASKAFAAECKRVLAASDTSDHVPALPQQKRIFLEALAASSNVTASAEKARISSREVYKLRREDSEFARSWQAALYEGYVNLEMEILGYLRDPKPERKMDVANALRLLAAHKETVAREHAVRRNVSTAQVRASIDRKVEEIRKRVMEEKQSKGRHDA